VGIKMLYKFIIHNLLIQNTKKMETNTKKVLIAMDYDFSSQKVAEAGFSLAKSLRAEVILLHVISNPQEYYSTQHVTVMGFAGHKDPNPTHLDSPEKLREASQHFLDQSKQNLGYESIQTIVTEGDAADSILKTAEYFQVNVIVLGSDSRKWLEKTNKGSITEKILQHSSIPIFIIPANSKLVITQNDKQ
jgi:nucleotide-binding universal stress UspA family protein